MSLIFAFILQYASLYGLDPNLVSAVVQHESAYNAKAVGTHGEIGLMQLKPDSFPKYTRKQLFDPETNIRVGTEYLAKMRDECVHRNYWLVCYNTAPEGAKKIKHPEKFKYYRIIRNLMEKSTMAMNSCTQDSVY